MVVVSCKTAMILAVIDRGSIAQSIDPAKRRQVLRRDSRSGALSARKHHIPECNGMEVMVIKSMRRYCAGTVKKKRHPQAEIKASACTVLKYYSRTRLGRIECRGHRKTIRIVVRV